MGEKTVKDYFEEDRFLFRIGKVNYKEAKHPLEEHVHRSMIELVFMKKGSQAYRVGGKEYTVKSGQIFCTGPDEQHGTGSRAEDKADFYFLIVNLSDMEERGYLHCREEAVLLKERLLEGGRRIFGGSDQILDNCERLLRCVEGDAQFCRTRVRNLLSDILMDAAECRWRAKGEAEAQDGEGQERALESRMQDVLQYIEENLDQKLSMEELAEKSCRSVSRFKTSFREQFGIPPREYVLRRKIERAKKLLLEDDREIVAISCELGFSTSQYFATVFKRFTCMTPVEYRKLSGGENVPHI